MTALTPRNDTIALVAICLGALMFGLEITSVPVILPTLEQLLHGDFTAMQWVMNAYTIACTTVLMATGTLADRFGRRRVFLVSVTAFALTSMMCGLAPDMPLLIVSRFLQGMAGGAMFICSIALLSHQFENAHERSRAFAAWGIVAGVGLGFGPLIGSAITAQLSWHWIFLVHVPLAVVTLVLAASSVSESRDPQAQRLDVAGVVTLSLAVFGLTFFITQGPALGLASPGALAILAASAACAVAFVIAERRQSRPMFDFSVFRIRPFTGAILGCVGMNFSYWPLMIYLPIYFQIGLGYGTMAAGLCLLAYTLPTLLFPPLGERLALRYGAGRIIPISLFTIGFGFMVMKLGIAADQPSWLTMLPGLLIAGIGLGMTNTPVTNTTTSSVPSDRAGMASGIDVSARLITLAVNIALMGFILIEGITSTLESASAGPPNATRLRILAETIAAGDAASIAGGTHGMSRDVIQAAIAQGFGAVLLYGGVGVWVLAGLSFAFFRAERAPATLQAREDVR